MFVDEGMASATPYGSGLALLENAEGQLDASGLWLRVAVRDGRPQLIAIESRSTEEPITTNALRFPLRKAVRHLIRTNTIRLERDLETGEIYGVYATSPTGPGEIRSVEERTADVDRATHPKRGRPRLTDEFLSTIATTWRDAQDQGRAASYELATVHNVAPSTVRQWMFKARARGLARKEEEDG
jgi:hypothetical protein